MLTTIYVTTRPKGFELWIKSCYLPFRPLTTQLQSKVHELDLSTASQLIQPRKTLHLLGPLIHMVHDMINNDSTMSLSDVDRVLSVNRAASTSTNRAVHAHRLYVIKHVSTSHGKLVDRGANGGLAGSDMKVIHKTNHKINIVGIDNHELTGLDVVTASCLFHTPQGKIVGSFNEYAYLGRGCSIHSPGQVEHFKLNVCDKFIKVGGKQHIQTLEGHTLPLSIKNGLDYLKCCGVPSNSDLEKYSHVMFASPGECDPSILDCRILALLTLIPFLQYFNQRFPRCLCS